MGPTWDCGFRGAMNKWGDRSICRVCHAIRRLAECHGAKCAPDGAHAPKSPRPPGVSYEDVVRGCKGRNETTASAEHLARLSGKGLPDVYACLGIAAPAPPPAAPEDPMQAIRDALARERKADKACEQARKRHETT